MHLQSNFCEHTISFRTISISKLEHAEVMLVAKRKISHTYERKYCFADLCTPIRAIPKKICLGGGGYLGIFIMF